MPGADPGKGLPASVSVLVHIVSPEFRMINFLASLRLERSGREKNHAKPQRREEVFRGFLQ
jgi:hypothetical protein